MYIHVCTFVHTNVKSIKVTNGENKENIPLQVSPKGGGGAGA